MEDDLLIEFINESREHLATIEADLLAIEEGGANVDEELVNKVFRAAHSIKGGSGFFGLTKVKELAHKAETVLDMLRSKKIVPNAEVTNVLLGAFDKLREMINNPGERESADIADLVFSLTSLASSYLPAEKKASLTQTVVIPSKGERPAVNLPQVDFDRAERAGQYVYSVDYDLIHDIERKGLNVLRLFHDLEEVGEILECVLDFEAAGTLDMPLENKLPLRLIYATEAQPDSVDTLFNVAAEKVSVLCTPGKSTSQPDDSAEVTPVDSPASAPSTLSTPASPRTESKLEEPSARPPAEKPAQSDSSAASGSKSSADETLRVNVGLLETLMNLAGEMVLSRNQLRAAIAQNNVEALSSADQRLNQVTSELQEAIMRTRLQPIGNVFGKFPRVVRDMANTLHKEIEVDVQGKDVALDRSLIEGLSDPLTHMVRNSADHGIESPDQRARAGKKRVGTIRIEARHEAGQVVIEIADDGKGIDPHKIGEAAVAKGLIAADRMRGMSDQDKVALVFLPGLSTAEKVSDVSGRGVGMDVVKTNLDRLGGKVEIKSEVGKGTLIRIKLPLTLAIIPSLIMSVEGERFAIPQINVEELLHIRAEDVKKRIEVIGDAEVLLLRDKIIPVVRFDSFLEVSPSYIAPATGTREIDRRVHLADRRSRRQPLVAEPEEAGMRNPAPQTVEGEPERRHLGGRRVSAAGALEIAVVTTGTLQYGMVVGSFHNTEEIVVKPLGRHLKALREYAGATILGDGTVALILDVAGFAAKAELASVSRSDRAVELSDEAEREKRKAIHSLLLFHNGPDEVCAIPLDVVLRIERVTVDDVELKGGRRTMQYRGASLPLVTLSDSAPVKPIAECSDLAVIVSTVNGHEVGLLGTMPVDVVETRADIDQVTHRQRGIVGSAVIHDRTTLIADVFELVEGIYPEWGATNAAPHSGESDTSAVTVLLAEDSDFFRSQVKRYLEEDGIIVLEAPDGEAAWEVLTHHLDDVRVVVTDIEMPRMTGLELAQRIRSDTRTANLPVIAMTSLAGDEDIARGKAAGIDDYQVKLDRDQLLASVRSAAKELQVT